MYKKWLLWKVTVIQGENDRMGRTSYAIKLHVKWHSRNTLFCQRLVTAAGLIKGGSGSYWLEGEVYEGEDALEEENSLPFSHVLGSIIGRALER